jgi:hypothetical protein
MNVNKRLVVTIIPNWNLKVDLGECLDSLSHVTYPFHRVIVVDNASTDGSPELVRDQYPWVELITLPENIGYAGALNVGIAKALEWGAAYVLGLNNDTVMSPRTIQRMVEVMESDLATGIASPKILHFYNPQKIYSLGERIYRWLPLPVSFGRGWPNLSIFSRIWDFDYVTGCAIMIRTSLFHEVGLFDPSFFMYYEDADFCRRVRERGYRIVCVGDVEVYHKVSKSAKKRANFIYRIRARNRVRFYRRHRHGPHPLLTTMTLIIVAFYRSAIHILCGKSELAWSYLLGLRDGLQEHTSINR